MASNKYGSTVELNSIAASDHTGNNHNMPRANRQRSKPKVEHYFYGPRDLTRHSKIPLVFRLHGSVLPHLIVPLCLISVWTVALCYIFIDRKTHKTRHTFDSTLLTVMGFLVGIGLSLRNSTAYERFSEGRRCWQQLNMHITNLARMIWISVKEREGDLGKQDLLGKIAAINLLNAFARALMHRLRFEPYVEYDDLKGYIAHLNTYAREANQGISAEKKKPGFFKRVGQALGLQFAQDNPRALVKNASKPIGNLPLEILMHIQAYMDNVYENKTLSVAVFQQQSMVTVQSLNDVLTSTDRIVNTPLPIAYSITISQIVWVYILVLPFMIMTKLQFLTIPACIIAAYILLGLLVIGTELENPFGDGVNDLPLENFCDQIQHDCDVIVSRPAPKAPDFYTAGDNLPLYPLYGGGYNDWYQLNKEEIAMALKAKMDIRGVKQTAASEMGV